MALSKNTSNLRTCESALGITYDARYPFDLLYQFAILIVMRPANRPES